jgi:hypothetical protein
MRKPGGTLTPEERGIVKALLVKGWRNQDIQALVNIGRLATVNSARITEVKKNKNIAPADCSSVEFFIRKKKSYDPETGLNLFDDERLIRAREAMILAVQIFNSPAIRFKTEVFAILANVAWTYLLHEFYIQKGVNIVGNDGRSLLISQILKRPDCPLSELMKKNLEDVKLIRDEVEHKILGRGDQLWLSRFQANCLNFDSVIRKLFGETLSLQNELAFALQFARLRTSQISGVQKYEIPERIEALDARLKAGMTEEEISNIEYQFRVVYTLESSSKSQSHIQFIMPGSEEAREIHNVLLKYKPADELYPHKPRAVIAAVAKKSGKSFTSHNHTQAWQKYKIRPRKNATDPAVTNREYCIYHVAHQDYTYSDKWIDFLVSKIASSEGFDEIVSFRI